MENLIKPSIRISDEGEYLMNRQTFALGGLLALAALLVLIAIGSFNSSASDRTTVAMSQPHDTGRADLTNTRRDVLIGARAAEKAPVLSQGTWINSEPLKLDSLRGRVVVVDFWTFGCYNCRNTLPTLKRWDARYRAQGLTIIGVHTPESGREKKVDNVRRAVRELEIVYPVVTDEDRQTWRAYNIEAWPTTIILDKQGRVRFTHIGEGYYDEMERAIQKLLAE
jgi:thiol-disulfide isomerase/thioredoxin